VRGWWWWWLYWQRMKSRASLSRFVAKSGRLVGGPSGPFADTGSASYPSPPPATMTSPTLSHGSQSPILLATGRCYGRLERLCQPPSSSARRTL
jgi:hypothetical protein